MLNFQRLRRLTVLAIVLHAYIIRKNTSSFRRLIVLAIVLHAHIIRKNTPKMFGACALWRADRFSNSIAGVYYS